MSDARRVVPGAEVSHDTEVTRTSPPSVTRPPDPPTDGAGCILISQGVLARRTGDVCVRWETEDILTEQE